MPPPADKGNAPVIRFEVGKYYFAELSLRNYEIFKCVNRRENKYSSSATFQYISYWTASSVDGKLSKYEMSNGEIDILEIHTRAGCIEKTTGIEYDAGEECTFPKTKGLTVRARDTFDVETEHFFRVHKLGDTPFDYIEHYEHNCYRKNTPADNTPLFIEDINLGKLGLHRKKGKYSNSCYYIDGKYTASWKKYYDALKERWLPAIKETVEYKILATFNDIVREYLLADELFSLLDFEGETITNYSKLAVISSGALQIAAENNFLDVEDFDTVGNDKSALRDIYRLLNRSFEKYFYGVKTFNEQFAELMDCKEKFDSATAALAELVNKYPAVWKAMQDKEFHYTDTARLFIPEKHEYYNYALKALKMTDEDFFTTPDNLNCNFIDCIEKSIMKIV